MTDTKPIADHPAVAKAQAKPSPTPAADKEAPAMVTLDELAREMNIPPRDARMLLRLAARQTKLYPTLGKEHTPRQPWQWRPGTTALEEARKALTSNA